MNLKKIICAIAMLISAHGAFAQGDVYERSQTYEWPTDPLVVKKLKQWQDLTLLCSSIGGFMLFQVLWNRGLFAMKTGLHATQQRPTINTKHGIGAYPTRSIPQSLTPNNGPQHSTKQG